MLIRVCQPYSVSFRDFSQLIKPTTPGLTAFSKTVAILSLFAIQVRCWLSGQLGTVLSIHCSRRTPAVVDNDAALGADINLPRARALLGVSSGVRDDSGG